MIYKAYFNTAFDWKKLDIEVVNIDTGQPSDGLVEGVATDA